MTALIATVVSAFMALQSSPPSDIFATLAAEAAAMIGEGPQARLLLNETRNGVASTRSLAVGDEYADGWRIDALSALTVTLRRDEVVHEVALGRPVGETAGSLRMSLKAAALTNAVEGPRLPAPPGEIVRPGPRPPADPVEIRAGVAEGDPLRVLEAGGTDEELQAAVETLGARIPTMALRPGERVSGESFDPRTGERSVTIIDADGTPRLLLTRGRRPGG